MGFDYITSPPLLRVSLWFLLYVSSCRRSFLVGSSLFLSMVILQIVMILCACERRWAQGLFTLPSPLLNWRAVFPCIVLFVGSFYLSALWVYHPTTFWPVRFLMKNPLIVLWGFPFMWQITFFSTFNILSLSLNFENLIVMCLGMDFFRFNLFEFLWPSLFWTSTSFLHFGKCLAFISLNILSDPFLLYSSSRTPIMYILVPLVVSHKSLKLSSLAFILLSCLLFLLHNFQWPVFGFVDAFFCLI